MKISLKTFSRNLRKYILHLMRLLFLYDQILIYLKQQWRPVLALYSDANGLYAKVGLWYCKVCGWHNEDVPKCHQCGRPRPE